MSGLNKVILAVGLAAAAYSAWGTYHQRLFPQAPLKAKPYVVVYGRDECGYCQALQRDLRTRGVPYEWKKVDDEAVQRELIPRMQGAGLETGYFDIPVVDVSGEMMIRPDSAVVVSRYGF